MTSEPVPEDGAQDGGARAVLGKLLERQEARAREREARQQAAEQEADPREDVNAFLARLSSDQRRLREQLQQASADAAAGLAGAARERVLQQLEEASCGISELEQATSAAAFFLPPYELRSATAGLQELRCQLGDAKQQLQPKRRFAFSKAVTRTAAAAPAAAEQQQPEQQQAMAAVVPQPSAHDLQLIAAGHGCMGLRGRVLVMDAEQLSGQSLVLHDLQDCTVFLLGAMSALRLQQLVNCSVVTGPVSGATFISGASKCTFMVAAHQVRIHGAQQCDFYLRVRSRPIIEHSSGLRFAPYAAADVPAQKQQGQEARQMQHTQPHLQPHDKQQQQQQQQPDEAAAAGVALLLSSAGLDDSSGGLWRQVDDFGWVKATPSPNWVVLPESERQPPPQPPQQG